MSKTHWRTILTTDYLGGADLDDGSGGHKDIIATIEKAGKEKVKDQNGKDEVCLVMRLVGLKPMILNVTNSKMLEKLHGTSYIEDWKGRQIQIGTERVKAFGDMHDALRIRKFLPKSDTKHICNDCKKEIKSVANATVETIASGTLKTYGVELCFDCAKKRKGTES